MITIEKEENKEQRELRKEKMKENESNIPNLCVQPYLQFIGTNTYI